MQVIEAMTNDKAALLYYEAAFRHELPLWVPATVQIWRTVRSEVPFSRAHIKPGEIAVECNQWRAVSAISSDGTLLGLKPEEFEVLTWREVGATAADCGYEHSRTSA